MENDSFRDSKVKESGKMEEGKESMQ